MTAPDLGPLVFLHVPKTGGASLIRALRTFAPPGQAYTWAGNRLSQALAEQFAGAGLPPSAVIHGHPDWGACRPLRGHARIITLLREPRRQIVSHYLHATRDAALPQHAAAVALGLKGFLRAFPYGVPFQTHHLYQSITDPEEERRRAIADPDYGGAFQLERYFAAQLAPVFTFLDEMALVGTLEALDGFTASLADLSGWSHVPRLTHDNAAPRRQQADIASLLEQVQELEAEPELAPLFAIEHATYARARALLAEAERRRFRARMKAGLGAPGPRMAHRSPFGEIVLGENFEQPEIDDVWGESPSPAPSQWRTGERQVSRLYVRRTGGRPCRLVLHVERLVAVAPGEIMLRQGDRWLELEIATKAGGGVTLSAALDAPAPGDDGFSELDLYLQWNRYAEQAPFYPRIRLAGLALAPLASGPQA